MMRRTGALLCALVLIGGLFVTTAAGITKIARTGIPNYDPWATAAPGMHFDPAAASFPVEFFAECLTFIEGDRAGQPFELEPWQQAIVANMFGWRRKDGTRRYRQVLLYVPRKNGKSPMMAGVALFVLVTDGEPGAQCYCAAADRDQASLVFRHAFHMSQAEPELRAHFKHYKTSRTLILLNEDGAETPSFFRALTSEDSSKHGFSTHLLIVDELHAQANSDLMDALQTGQAARTQPLSLLVTTADYMRPSPCNAEYDYACKVRDGIIDDPAYLPIIYEAGSDDDWADPDVWAKANPNLGVSVQEDYIRRNCQHAQERPAYENTFKRLHLNVRTEQDVRWLPMDKWDACGPAEFSLAAYRQRLDQLEGAECYGGLDLATNRDPAALVLFFPETGDMMPWFWIPGDNVHDRARRDRVPYEQWVRDGLVTTTAGNVIDQDFIRKAINVLGKRYNIREIALDRWNATQLMVQLGGDGFEMVPFGQGYASMAGPAKEFENRVLGGQFAHQGHPVLRWMASNASVEIDAAGNIKPSKKRSTERIDGIVAAIMALGRAIAQDGPPKSVYQTRGLIRL